MTDEVETQEEGSVLSLTPLADEGPSFEIANYGDRAFYGGETFTDDKTKTKFIKTVVAMVRKCPEYGRYRNFLLENLDMDRCSILSGLDQDESKAAGLELHHAPLSLYDITELVLGQMLYDQKRITTFSIANLVMAYHWKGYVGLVPLTETVHEAVHSGQVHVDPRSIFGNWQALLMENSNGLTEHLAEKLRFMAEGWMSGEIPAENARVLTIGLQRWTANEITISQIMSPPELSYGDDSVEGVL